MVNPFAEPINAIVAAKRQEDAEYAAAEQAKAKAKSDALARQRVDDAAWFNAEHARNVARTQQTGNNNMVDPSKIDPTGSGWSSAMPNTWTPAQFDAFDAEVERVAAEAERLYGPTTTPAEIKLHWRRQWEAEHPGKSYDQHLKSMTVPPPVSTAGTGSNNMVDPQRQSDLGHGIKYGVQDFFGGSNSGGWYDSLDHGGTGVFGDSEGRISDYQVGLALKQEAEVQDAQALWASRAEASNVPDWIEQPPMPPPVNATPPPVVMAPRARSTNPNEPVMQQPAPAGMNAPEGDYFEGLVEQQRAKDNLPPPVQGPNAPAVQQLAGPSGMYLGPEVPNPRDFSQSTGINGTNLGPSGAGTDRWMDLHETPATADSRLAANAAIEEARLRETEDAMWSDTRGRRGPAEFQHPDDRVAGPYNYNAGIQELGRHNFGSRRVPDWQMEELYGGARERDKALQARKYAATTGAEIADRAAKAADLEAKLAASPIEERMAAAHAKAVARKAAQDEARALLNPDQLAARQQNQDVMRQMGQDQQAEKDQFYKDRASRIARGQQLAAMRTQAMYGDPRTQRERMKLLSEERRIKYLADQKAEEGRESREERQKDRTLEKELSDGKLQLGRDQMSHQQKLDVAKITRDTTLELAAAKRHEENLAAQGASDDIRQAAADSTREFQQQLQLIEARGSLLKPTIALYSSEMDKYKSGHRSTPPTFGEILSLVKGASSSDGATQASGHGVTEVGSGFTPMPALLAQLGSLGPEEFARRRSIEYRNLPDADSKRRHKKQTTELLRQEIGATAHANKPSGRSVKEYLGELGAVSAATGGFGALPFVIADLLSQMMGQGGLVDDVSRRGLGLKKSPFEGL